ncbi:MAG: hypothetical protein J6Y69_11500 [Treponema sp.]|nr:hypothetical protein [Treponema sp.]
MIFNYKRYVRYAGLIHICALSLSLSACKKENRLLGKWTASNNVSIYEFEESEYRLNIEIMFTTICIKGTYRIEGDKFLTTAKQTSYDNGQSWSKNKGELIPKEEYEGKIQFNDDGTITIDGLVYTKS